MGQSVYEIIEGNNNEAYAKLRETALQPETGVDASSLGQLRDAIKSDSFRRRTAGIDVDGIDDLILYASQRKPLCSLPIPLCAVDDRPPVDGSGHRWFQHRRTEARGQGFQRAYRSREQASIAHANTYFPSS